MYPDCLKDIVGLVRDGSKCLEGTTISNVSTIDLFVDQDPSYDTCRFKGGEVICKLIELMNDRREEALKAITRDVGAILMGKVKARTDFSTFIGQNSFSSDYSPSLVPANPSIEIYTEYQPGAYIRIDRIALMIYPKAGTITVPLQIYRVYGENDAVLIHTYNIEVARRSTTLNPVLSFNIPCDGLTYRIQYEFHEQTMTVPMSNIECGCGDQLRQARGFRLVNNQKSYGISLWVTYKCYDGQVICNLLRDETYRLVIGNMIRRQILVMIMQRIYDSQEVNRYTLLSSEDMVNRIEAYNLEYNENLRWLSEQREYDLGDGFCLTCGSGGSGMRKVNLLTGV
jgi:hypothetical protein